MPFTTTEASNILNWMLGKKSALSAKNKVYIGLLSNDPEASGGTCTELIATAAPGYSRVLISQYNEAYPDLFNSTNSRVIKNKGQINWNKAEEKNWPEVKGIALYESESGGSPFYYAKLKTPLTVEKGAVALFEKDKLQIGFSDTDEDIEADAT